MTNLVETNAQEWTREELEQMDPSTLVKYCLDAQHAYASVLNTLSLYKRQLNAAQAQTLRSSQIADLSRRINVDNLDLIVKVAVEDVPRFFEAKYGALFLYDEESNLLGLKAASPSHITQHALDMDTDTDVMVVHLLQKHSSPVLINSFADFETMAGCEFRPVPADEALMNGGLLCPLQIHHENEEHSRPVGALLIGEKDGGFHQYDSEIATMLCEMLATAISTARLFERMALLAETDGLTHLYNHRHFQQELDRAMAFAQRYKVPLSLMMIDIDHFKKFNDSFGHQTGDRMLKEVARLINQAVRDKVDIVARYGGEEFAVILPHTDIKGARVAGERLRGLVESTQVSFANQAHTVTVSVGLAEFNPEQEKSSFVETADRALYCAKNAGRNRLCVSGEDIA